MKWNKFISAWARRNEFVSGRSQRHGSNVCGLVNCNGWVAQGVCGYPSPQNEVSQEKGGETGHPGHPTPTAMQLVSSSDFKPPTPGGGGGTSLQANVESQSKVSLDKPGLVKNLFLESPGNYQVRR